MRNSFANRVRLGRTVIALGEYVMDAEKKASVLRGMIQRMAAGGADIQTADWLEFVAAQNDGALTGPPIGAKAPSFSLPDQHGNMRTLADLSGPNVLLLVFSRSADW